jgi:hypothetical protein
MNGVAGMANVTLRNVVFFISDDFRPSSGAYGNQDALTPNLDRLAAEGTLFAAAHVQFSYCAPSRNSFMSGRRPDATKAFNFLNHFRETGIGDEWVALPELFKRAGYLVTGANKLYRARRAIQTIAPNTTQDQPPEHLILHIRQMKGCRLILIYLAAGATRGPRATHGPTSTRCLATPALSVTTPTSASPTTAVSA